MSSWNERSRKRQLFYAQLRDTEFKTVPLQSNEGSSSTSSQHSNTGAQSLSGTQHNANDDHGDQHVGTSQSAHRGDHNVDVEMSDNIETHFSDSDNTAGPSAKKYKVSRKELTKLLKEARADAKLQEERVEVILDQARTVNRHYQVLAKQHAQLKAELVKEQNEAMVQRRELKEELEKAKAVGVMERLEEVDGLLDDVFLCAICQGTMTVPASLGTPCGHTFCVQCLIGAWASVVINVRRIDEHFENDPPNPFKRMKCPECRAEVPDDLPPRRAPRDLATFPFTLHPAMQRQIEKMFDRAYALLKEAKLPPSHPLMEKYNTSEGTAASPAQRRLLIRRAERTLQTFQQDWRMFKPMQMRQNINFYLGVMEERWPPVEVIELSSDDEGTGEMEDEDTEEEEEED